MVRPPYAACILVAAVAAACAPAVAESPGAPFAASVPRVAGLRDLGRAPDATRVSIAVTLPYRHATELEALIDAQNDRGSRVYRRFLSNAQFNGYFAPSARDYGRVTALLQRAGFGVVRAYENRTLLLATAPVRVAERYFTTEVHAVLQPGYGTRYANVRPGVLPEELKGLVDTLVGLDDLAKARWMHEFGRRSALVEPQNIGGPLHGPDGGFGPIALANGFDFPVQHGFDGTGETVANVAGDIADSDLAAFEKFFGIKRKGKLIRTTIQQPASDANVEATLDVETMASLDPGADVHLYILENPIDQVGEQAYNQIVSDNSVVAVNSSFGICESSDLAYATAAQKIIAQGEAKGISWSASTGDGGGQQCGGPQIAPAVIPRVTGVGGTSLTVDSKGNYVSESAWSGSGGGPSLYFKLPGFQKGVRGLGSTTKRNLPDVAFPADPGTGYSFYYQGAWSGPIGGTSWSSPTFVALQAEIDQIEKARGGETNPKIYEIFETTQYKAFHDITTGSNGYRAKVGYDNATGIGSFKAYTFAQQQ